MGERGFCLAACVSFTGCQLVLCEADLRLSETPSDL